jgi:hypothetical protein
LAGSRLKRRRSGRLLHQRAHRIRHQLKARLVVSHALKHHLVEASPQFGESRVERLIDGLFKSSDAARQISDLSQGVVGLSRNEEKLLLLSGRPRLVVWGSGV